jgi:adenosylcobinamide-GDP ribazoletransferase
MTAFGVRLGELAADLRTSLLFYTRLPLAHPGAIAGIDLARAAWAAPLIGATVGALGAAAYGLAYAAGLPSFASAALALATTLAATGCLHEDGLADTADGFGGGATRERKLAIMRDSRIGTYGTCALLLSLLLRTGAIASLSAPVRVACALVAAHAAARATLPAFMQLVPRARADGLSHQVGKPSHASTTLAAVLGLVALALGLGITRGLVALIVLVGSVACMAWLCTRQIGGQTGDVIGALEQANEILILLVAAARF